MKNNNIKTKISKRKRIKEKIVLRKEKRETRKKPTITFEEEIDEKDCPQNHENLNILFKSEEDAAYWNPGGSMYGVFCKGCKGSFYDSKICRPTVKNPAMTCIGREEHGCAYAFCNTCYKNKLFEEDSKNGNGRRTKRTRRKK